MDKKSLIKKLREEIFKKIEQKNSWGKNELRFEIEKIFAETLIEELHEDEEDDSF